MTSMNMLKACSSSSKSSSSIPLKAIPLICRYRKLDEGISFYPPSSVAVLLDTGSCYSTGSGVAVSCYTVASLLTSAVASITASQ